MKKKLLILLCMILCTTGCFSFGKDRMEDIVIYTSVYPVEYITNYLYGKNATIYSIYTDGINPFKLRLNNKQLKDCSHGDIFIYNSLMTYEGESTPTLSEINYAIEIRKLNDKIKFIDAASNIYYDYEIQELWFNPSNLLAMAQNIVDAFGEYIENPYLLKEIEENFNSLKIELTQIDASFKKLYENSTTKTLIVSNDMFKFLENKYNIKVISLQEGENLTDRVLADATKLIEEETVKYIFALEGEELNDEIKRIQDKTKIEVLRINPLNSITEANRNNKEDYVSLMNKNIELFQKELYKK